MFVIKMIKRITGLNQEELADFFNVSRASINSWINSNETMTTYQKHIISEKFDVPIELLTDDLIDNYEQCRELYGVIQSKWKIVKQKNTISSEDEILNKLEYQFFEQNDKSISEREIIEGLTNGYNPYTGELFEADHILNDSNINNFLNEIKNKYFKYSAKNITKEDLDSKQRNIFEELRKWRKDMTAKEGFFSAYMVFSDKELINIVTSNINKKEDLLNVKGIATIKYNKYGDDIFYILKTGSYDFDINF